MHWFLPVVIHITFLAFRVGLKRSFNKDNTNCPNCRIEVNISAIQDDRTTNHRVNDILMDHVCSQQFASKQNLKIADNTKRTKKKDIIALLAVHGKFTRQLLFAS